MSERAYAPREWDTLVASIDVELEHWLERRLSSDPGLAALLELDPELRRRRLARRAVRRGIARARHQRGSR
jgi:hypothetical protein